MKLMSYAEALKMGKDKVNEMLVPVRVRRARKQAELQMISLEEKIATKTSELHELCAAQELDFDAIIDLQDDLGILKRRQAQYQKILDEMFPKEGDE